MLNHVQSTILARNKMIRERKNETVRRKHKLVTQRQILERQKAKH